MKRLLGMILAGGLCAGCDPRSVGVFVNVEVLVVTNTDDNFTIAGVGTNINGSRTYAWNCSTNQANVTIGSNLTAGWIRLQAWDHDGKLVHDNRYEAALIGAVTSFTAADGTLGSWTLKFTFHDALFSGALTVNADTLPDPDEITVAGATSLDVTWIFEPGWTANPVNVDIAGMSSGTVRVRLWDGANTLVYDNVFFGIGGGTATPTGAAGVWRVQLDFNSCISLGAVSLGQ
jgi:hypothetical protein